MTRTSKAATPQSLQVAPISDAEILGAMLADPAGTFRRLLPLAAVEWPGLVAESFDATAISAAAERIVARTHPGVTRTVEQLLSDIAADRVVHDAVFDRLWAMSECGFALGILTGLRLTGGRRPAES